VACFVKLNEYMHLLGSNLSKFVFHLVMSRSLWLRLYLVSCQLVKNSKSQFTLHQLTTVLQTSDEFFKDGIKAKRVSQKIFFKLACILSNLAGYRIQGINDESWVYTWLKAQKTALLYALLRHKSLLAFVIQLHNYMYTKGLLTD